jgi:amino acid transporter
MNRPNEQDRPTTSDTLRRSLSVWNNLTIGFAVVSPVVGLYAIIGVQTAVTGDGWFAALAICLVMQLLVAIVYAELTSQFPIAGGFNHLMIGFRANASFSHYLYGSRL